MSEEDTVADPKWTVKQKCAEFLKGFNLIRTLIILVCLGVVLEQISACFSKLFINIPITTYTHFDFNKTIVYPSITLCREPPYKYDKLLEYGLYSHPRYTSTWMAFNFSEVTLDQLWDEITYNDQDMFVQYGFGGSMTNVNLTSNLGFVMGRCYTVSPMSLSTQATKSSGYSITLKHSAADIETSTSINPPGYHVHVHYTREPYTEVEVYNGGLVDHLYVNVGESLDVKLKVDKYVMISSEDDPCSHESNYSANICTAQYVWDEVGATAGCSGPWMISDLPRCNNYTAMRTLITSYMSTYTEHNCTSCPRFCSSYLYNTYVTDRQSLITWDSTEKQWRANTGDAALEIQLYLYFNSMMVSVYEERYNYDWNLFLSDLGGSVGFLLGLSVIGLMNVFEKSWNLFISPYMCYRKTKKTSISDSASTVDVHNVARNNAFLERNGSWTDKQVD